MLGPVPPRTYDHVAVLLGGLSAERPVSLKSGAAVAQALRGQGYQVTEVDVGRNLAETLTALAPDVCFNALHGAYGEDGAVQGLLEVMAIPYTHSGVLSSALAMHKEHAKTAMAAVGVPIAKAELVTRRDALRAHVMPPPYVVKPVAEGSSVGVIIVGAAASAPPALIGEGETIDLDEIVMVERFVPGRELTCAVFGDIASDVIEILPADGLEFYDFEAKYAPGGSKHVLPAELSSFVYQLVRRYALDAHQALGCRGVTRADFRFDATTRGPEGFDSSGGLGVPVGRDEEAGELVCLEVNTQPGMTTTSLVPELAQHAGWSFGELVQWIVEDASCQR